MLEGIVSELRKLMFEQPEEFMPELSAMLGKCGVALVEKYREFKAVGDYTYSSVREFAAKRGGALHNQ